MRELKLSELFKSTTQDDIQHEEPRGPGRPKKWTDAAFIELLADYEQMCADFARQHGRQPISDVELLTVMVANHLRQEGLRESRISNPAVQAKLKSIRNRISQARNR